LYAKLKHAFKCLITALVLLPQLTIAQNSYARKGVLDLREWNFSEGAANLTGEWEFYMSELIAPGKFTSDSTAEREYIDFPSTWNDLSKSLNPGEGYATYRLTVLVNTSQPLAFELPHFYSNYAFWVNSNPIAANGTVGTSEKTSTPQWLPQTVTFIPASDTLDIVVQASNFHHAKGGVRENILLGATDSLLLKRQVAVISTVFIFSILIIISGIFITLFFVSKKRMSMIYFAFLCITWAARSILSNLYVATSFFPDLPWELCVKIEYLSLYLMMMWAILFLASIFRHEVSTTFKYFICICNGVFVLLTLFFKASMYTQFLPVYLSFVTILLLYVIYVLIRAIVTERQGVWLLVTCFFLGVILFSYDMISYQGFATFNPVILNFGYIVMFGLMTVTLLMHTGYLKKSVGNSNMLTYEEMFGPTKEVQN
jgi:hypothetical protein